MSFVLSALLQASGALTGSHLRVGSADGLDVFFGGLVSQKAHDTRQTVQALGGKLNRAPDLPQTKSDKNETRKNNEPVHIVLIIVLIQILPRNLQVDYT